MSKQIIAIDADDTLFDENTAMRLYQNEKYGTNHTAEEYLAPGEFGAFWKHIWGTDEKETMRRHEEFTVWKLEHNLPPLPHALDVLTELKKSYELVIVTSRDERAVQLTHEALTEHFPDIFKDVHFASVWGAEEPVTKAQICNEIGADYLIDDSLEHCELAAEAGVTGLLFGNYGWNSHQELPPNVIRLKDWKAVGEYFDGRC